MAALVDLQHTLDSTSVWHQCNIKAQPSSNSKEPENDRKRLEQSFKFYRHIVD